MKILLVRYHDGANINTRLPKNLNRIRGVMPPLGLLSIASYIEKFGYQVKIIDAVAERYNEKVFADFVQEYKPDICGVTTMIENYFGACQACKIAKSYGAITVLGGPGMEIYPAEMIAKDYIDYGVVGEGEETFLRLIQAIESGNVKEIQSIPGLSYKISDQIVVGKPQIVKNLDTLPLPAYHLININNYSSLINDHPIITYIMGRGCPYRCSFCFKQESDKSIRFRHPKIVVDDIEYLVSRYKTKEVMFYDDTFTLYPSQVNDVCEGLLQKGVKVKFEAPTRINNIVKPEGMELLKTLKKAGCYRLRLGVESGDLNILKIMKKGISLEEVRIAFDRCRQFGIKTFAYFIVGYLGENEDTFKNTVNFAIKLNPDHVMFTIATPYPRTRLYEESFNARLIPSDYWKDYILGHTTERIPYLVPNAEAMAKKAYKRFYFRLPYLVKTFRNLKSMQHVKNTVRGGINLLIYRNA